MQRNLLKKNSQKKCVFSKIWLYTPRKVVLNFRKFRKNSSQHSERESIVPFATGSFKVLLLCPVVKAPLH